MTDNRIFQSDNESDNESDKMSDDDNYNADDDNYNAENMYTGLFINAENIPVFITEQFVLGNLIRFSKQCQELSLGVKQNYVGEYTPFPKNNKGNKTVRGIIIVIPISRMNHYLNNNNNEINLNLNITDNNGVNLLLDDFKNGTIYSEAIGHCYFTWDIEQKICGIWDICLHGATGKGLGSYLMEGILGALLTHLPDDIDLWLGIDVRNKYFNRVASLYAKFGFKSPLISYIDPFGNDWRQDLPYGFISMKRNNDYIDPLDINRESVLTHIKYIRRNFININKHKIGDDLTDIDIDEVDIIMNNDISTSCTLNMRFNKSFARWLKRLPLSASSLNENGTITQKEISSSFFLDNPKENSDGKIIWEIIRDKKVEKKFGEELKAYPDQARYNFHTHPREGYVSNNIKISYPSPQDYIGFLNIALYNEIKTIFHCVITIEGIYTISLAEFWINHFNFLQNHIIDNKEIEKYNKKIEEIEKSKESKELKEIEKSKVTPPIFQINEQTRNAISIKAQIPNIQTIEQVGNMYSQHINNEMVGIIHDNNQNVYHEPVFHVSFNSWEDIINGQVISIYYPSLYDQCFIKHKTIKNFEKLNSSII